MSSTVSKGQYSLIEQSNTLIEKSNIFHRTIKYLVIGILVESKRTKMFPHAIPRTFMFQNGKIMLCNAITTDIACCI